MNNTPIRCGALLILPYYLAESVSFRPRSHLCEAAHIAKTVDFSVTSRDGDILVIWKPG